MVQICVGVLSLGKARFLLQPPPHPHNPPSPPSIEDSAAIASKQPEAELQRSVLAHHQRYTVEPQTAARFALLKEQVLPSAGYQGDTVDGRGGHSQPEVLSAEV